MKNIVIIGGGFSGTVAAINIARLSPAPLNITVIDDSPVDCRGVAYSTRNGSHLLNVVARNMSALADQPHHFVDWLETRFDYMDEAPAALNERFAPRRVYGEYLHSLFLWHATSLALEKEFRLVRVCGRAEDIAVSGEQATVTLNNGQTLVADKVVLALGNQPPADFRLRGLDLQSPKYIGNPWRNWEQKLPSPDRDLVVIGTGLTTVDVILTLLDLKWRGKIRAVSRNGLMPLSHFKGFDYPDPLADEPGPVSLRRMVAIFHRHLREMQARGLNPAILVDKLRPHTQQLWKNFSLFEKRQFNRHFRTLWNVTRHRIAPEIHHRLDEAMAHGQLEVLAGRLRECTESDDTLTLRVEGRQGARKIEAAALINCTGPRERYIPSNSRLITNLVSRGLIEPDEMNMGIKIAPNFAVVDAEGRESSLLFAIGSILKGTLWETIAVPELRSQTFRVAETIARQLTEGPAAASPIAEAHEEIIEYFI
ncbi:MAG TPA: FAD/NAD(P)-binding protein [Candidatus Methylacidiphilales bacterium]|nr:FAD/NAD(P)-binding protein [Candidatus Methylacidiphilales bacterium]